MPKWKKNFKEVVELKDEIKTIEIEADREAVREAVRDFVREAVSEADPQDEIEMKRNELIKLAEDEQFHRDVKAIKKASNKTIEKYYKEIWKKKNAKSKWI